MASESSEGEGSKAAAGRAERIGLVLAVAIPAGLVAFWLAPRPATPADMPPLVLPAAEVAREIAAEDALAETAIDDERETHRRALYRAQGRAEVHRRDTPEQASTRTAALAVLAHDIDQSGHEHLAAIRARDVSRMMPALRGTGMDEDDRAAELGAFPAMLVRYDAVLEGRRIAPEYVLRAMFFARWNAMHGLPLTEDMTPLRERAYYGWLALEGGEAPLGMRLEALEAYAAAGGTHVQEARGMLAFLGGELGAARAAFADAAEHTGSVRLRNHALAAERAEAEGDDEIAP